METTVVAIVRKLVYREDAHRHTAFQARESARLAEIEDWRGNFKAVIAPSLEEAVVMLRKQLSDWLLEREAKWQDVKADTFDFEVLYSEVENGEFWIQPCLLPCVNYPVILPSTEAK